MQIHGLQKMTLLDFPGRVACTVFLGGCDFRCPFCHNSELVNGSSPPLMDENEFFSFLSSRLSLLDGVCISGGEPLLNPSLPNLIRKIKHLGLLIKLDTNGNHPDRLNDLLEANLLDYVAMDVKNAPSLYAETIGLSSFDISPVRNSVSLLLNSPIPSEFRTTVVREFHSDASFSEIGPWIQGAKSYFLQPFVDRPTVAFSNLHSPSEEDLHRYLNIIKPFVENSSIRGL